MKMLTYMTFNDIDKTLGWKDKPVRYKDKIIGKMIKGEFNKEKNIFEVTMEIDKIVQLQLFDDMKIHKYTMEKS